MKLPKLFKASWRIALFLAFFVSFIGIALAQTPTGSVTGLVKDSTGAVVKGAAIVATNVETNVQYKTLSAQDGNYNLPSLPVGRYALTISADGFKSDQHTGITIALDQHAEINATMDTGSATDVVTVTADASQVESESHEMGEVVDNQKIEQLPLNSRNFNTLAYIVPGVYPPVFGSNLGYRGGFNVAGASEASNNFTVDGFDNNNEELNVASFRPSVDGIAEFKVLTGLYPAEYGRNSGGQIAVTTKNGTNQFHGVLYEYLRNQYFDASNYFIPAGQKPAFKRNQFGGTLGGPIFKNKTFFFFAYEGLRLHQTLASLTTVPEAGWVGTGNLSALLHLATPIALKNPYVPGAVIANNDLSTLPQWTGSAAVVGRAVASYYPNPTYSTAANAAPTNNYDFTPLRTETSNQYTLRVDHTFSQRDSMFGEYNYYNDESFEPSNSTCGSRLIPGFGCYSGLPLALIGLSETHVFTPTLLNTIKVGFNRYEQSRIQQDDNIDFVDKYGLKNVFLQPLPGNYGVPAASVTSFTTVGGPTNLPADLINNSYQIEDQVILSRGAHTFKAGVDIRRVIQNDLAISSGRGSFAFSASTATPTTGYALADLLLGLPTSTSNNPYAPKIYIRTSAFNGYFQDDWKASTKLTLNLGMRWELATPFVSADNQISSFDPTTGTLDVAGVNGYGRNLIQYDFSKFLPRVGFSYSLSPKTVLRGGYGMNAGTPPSFTGIGNLYYNPPMRNPQTFNSSTASQITLANPFPTTLTIGSSTPFSIDYHYLTPYIQQYGVGIQQQLTPNTLLDVSYLGSKGTHLVDAQNINQPVAQSAVTTVAGVNALRPFPNYGTIIQYQSRAASDYNSLQVKLDKRLSHGLNALVAYTFGKSLDNSGGYNSTAEQNGNLSRDYGHSDFDARHRLSISGLYELPFGNGKMFLTHGIASAIVGGWQISGIYQIQSGHYLTPIYSANVSNTYTNRDRPNVYGNPNNGPKTTAQWFTTADYLPKLATLSGVFGNAARNSILSPNYQDLDATLARTFQLPKSANLQFRAEFFNLANHPNFDPPNVTADSSAFGTIATAEDPREMQFALRITF